MIADESSTGPTGKPDPPPAAQGGIGSLRLVGFALLGVFTMVVARFGDDQRPIVLIWMVGAAWATAIVVDTVYHAWRGRGYACMKCGHRRRMASFHLSGRCPKCGA
jgi:hypothetical protein